MESSIVMEIGLLDKIDAKFCILEINWLANIVGQGYSCNSTTHAFSRRNFSLHSVTLRATSDF